VHGSFGKPVNSMHGGILLKTNAAFLYNEN